MFSYKIIIKMFINKKINIKMFINKTFDSVC